MTRDSRRSFPPAVAFLLFLISAHASLAATFTVSNLADSGAGSLRQAVLAANSAVGADEIVFTVIGTITLTSGEIAITNDLTITGPGLGALTVSGNDQSRIFNVDDGAAGSINVTLSGLMLTRGYAQGSGGAVRAANENLTIRGSVISDSVSDNSSATVPGCGGNVALGILRIEDSTLTGGVAKPAPDPPLGRCSSGGNLCAGRVLLLRSTLSGGSAECGGGFSGSGSILNSTISGNSAELGGGIYWSSLEEWSISGSTISDNTSEYGGGVYIDLGYLLFLNSTISGNTAGSDGGGIVAAGGGDGHPGSFATLRLTTVSNNTAAGSGSLLSGGYNAEIEIDHSIVANGTPEDINPAFSTYRANYSLIENPLRPTVQGSHNIVGVDPLLGPLTNNGGPTLTHAPLPGSPAINAGDPAIPDPPATDQRGFPRIAGPAVDLGSIEAAAFAINVPTLSEWAIVILSALLMAAGVWRLRAF